MTILPDKQTRSAATWILIPAAVMSLGWGLRGYIGGGPLGAMIPGVMVSLLLCRYLNYSAEAAAVVVAFGTPGIAFVGEETYGQTLGLLRNSDTFWWGLTGTTLKGAIWGLLGGAMLGLGFVARQMAWRHLLLALACLLVGVIVGIHLINEPKLIYFSNPVDRPRDESWAGFLFGALALLAYLRVFQPSVVWSPARFALAGLIAGGLGFGGGSLLLALRFHVTEPWHWLPYWKFMEFAFGFMLGAAYGRCAWKLRDRLAPLEKDGAIENAQLRPARDSTDDASNWWISLVIGAAVVTGTLYGWESAAERVSSALQDVPRHDLRHTLARVLLGFTGMGCLLMILSRQNQSVAWQTAVSVTIVAAAIDWQRDLHPRGDIELSPSARLAFVVSLAAISILFVSFWQHRRTPKLMDLFLFATCVLMAIGYMMGLGLSEIWWPTIHADVGESQFAFVWRRYRSEIVVHAIFTTLGLIGIWAALRERRAELTEISSCSRKHAD